MLREDFDVGSWRGAASGTSARALRLSDATLGIPALDGFVVQAMYEHQLLGPDGSACDGAQVGATAKMAAPI